jgi:hypothetical protein
MDGVRRCGRNAVAVLCGLRVEATTTGEYGQSKKVPARGEMGYEAAARAASQRAPPAISFLYLISARG